MQTSQGSVASFIKFFLFIGPLSCRKLLKLSDERFWDTLQEIISFAPPLEHSLEID